MSAAGIRAPSPAGPPAVDQAGATSASRPRSGWPETLAPPARPPVGARSVPADPEYEGYELLLGLPDKERAGPEALGWDHRRMRRLLGRLGDPQGHLRCTLVAGSKGKGSTAAMLEAILRADGRRTGLYTQPHLSRYAERIRVDGRELPPRRSRALLRRVCDAAPGPLTAFEAATAAALLHFAEAGVRDAVVEVGFGGRLDATAECEPALVLLTPLEEEHADLFGPTLADVAARELSLLTYGRCCRSAPQVPAVARLLSRRAAEHGVEAAVVRAPVPLPDGRLRFHTPAGHSVVAACGLPGRYQRVNAALAVAAAEVLGCPVAAVTRGLAEVRWPGRFERVADAPPVLLDGAHTPRAAHALAESLAEAYPGRPVALVVGLLADKDPVAFARELAGPDLRAWATAPRHARAMAATDVAAAFAAVGVQVELAPDVPTALGRARDWAAGRALCVVTGSLRVVAEARALLLGPP